MASRRDNLTPRSEHPGPGARLRARLWLLARAIMLLSLPYEAWLAYGDAWNFFALAREPGWPYLDYWVEFPPLYPFLAKLLYILAAGREHAFVYLHVGLMTAVQAANVALVDALARRLGDGLDAARRAGLYAVLTLGLMYTWGYFDPLAVLFMLLGLRAAWQQRAWVAGLAFGFGGLVKWFPALLVFPSLHGRARWRALAVMGVLLGGVWAWLWGMEPRFTRVSWQVQTQRAPWESPWALLQGRLHTGNLPAYERTANPPRAASAPMRWAPWLAFGLLLLLTPRRPRPGESDAAFRWRRSAWWLAAFFATSWGYSPQWVQYTLPVLLLALPWPFAGAWSVAWVGVHLLEWPLALSRGWFAALWLLVPLREVLLILALAKLVEGGGQGAGSREQEARSKKPVDDYIAS